MRWHSLLIFQSFEVFGGETDGLASWKTAEIGFNWIVFDDGGESKEVNTGHG
jgi:hypothetical protein